MGSNASIDSSDSAIRAERLECALAQLLAQLRDILSSLPYEHEADAFSGMRLSRSDLCALVERRQTATEGSVDPASSISIDWFPQDVAKALGLDDVDVAILLVALAPELDPTFVRIFGFLADDLTIQRPTVGVVTRLLRSASETRINSLARFLSGSPLTSSGLLHISPASRPDAALSSRELAVDPLVLKLALTGAGFVPLLGSRTHPVLGHSARSVTWREQLRLRSGKPPPDQLVEAATAFLPLDAAQIAAAVAASIDPECVWTERSEHGLLDAAMDVYRPRSPLGRHVPIRRALERDLIVPERTRAQLEGLRRRMAVHRAMRERLSLVGGLAALFTGPSGTGKTLAAECLARALGADLFRVSASRLYDKYVGETEKNIDQMFDVIDEWEATSSDSATILLIDEAEWLFSRRVDGRDAHDHYLNVRVGHLLQRLETFRGLAILTSNMPAQLDDAFRRRWFQHVEFELPDEEVRQRLWIHALASVCAESRCINTKALAAAYSLSGGSIRNVVVMAAYDACVEQVPLRMRHIGEPLAREFQKLGHRIEPMELIHADLQTIPEAVA